jgi:DNA-binding winged helix-turn-helix (wHTH) protein/predicted ATPase
MRDERRFVFGPFRLEASDEELWHGDTRIALGRKAIAVLRRLVEQPGQLVGKDDLFDAAWPQTAVSEAVLTTAIRELRHALGDPARTPRFIETVHGRGYRFIAPMTQPNGAVCGGEPSLRLVGREGELAQLHEWLAAVRHGTRRIGFVVGEAGIGKTVLVEHFLAEAAAGGRVLIGRGQCIEHYGAGEAYLPVLEILGRLGRESAERIAAVLREHAPSWLSHLPSPVFGVNLQTPAPATSARMLRELAEALEVLAARDLLILLLEDVHWSDSATLEWLAYMARRRDKACLLVLCTYRPVEALLQNHALRNMAAELRQHPQCGEMVLDYLSGEAVEEYVRNSCAGIPEITELAAVLRRRTGGHPLFLAAIVDEVLRERRGDAEGRGAGLPDPVDIASRIPSSARRFIEHRFELLSEADQRILHAAAVAGDQFCVSLVAEAAARPEDDIEVLCAAWARDRQFLVPDGETAWPDGSRSARYRFRHALYQEVLYARISPDQRARFHRSVGDRLERAYRKQAATVAAELAMHFEQGRLPVKALTHLRQAARNAVDRSAYAEAHRHLARAQEILPSLPEGRRRLRQELETLLLLGRVLMATKGWARDEVECLYRRARAICEQLGERSRLLETLWGMICVSFVKGDFRGTRILGAEVLQSAQVLQDTGYTILGHMELGGTTFHLGEPASATLRHFRRAKALYDPRQHRSLVGRFGVDIGLFASSWAAHYLWYAGFVDQARAQAEETIELARMLAHPFSLAITLAYATMLYQFCRDMARLDSLAEATIALCAEYGFPYYLAWAEVLQGWSHAVAGAPDRGIAEMRRGIQVLDSTAGARLPYYRSLLAEACGRAGRIDEAFEALSGAGADMQRTDERWWEPELHRLRGDLLRSELVNCGQEAEAHFRQGIEAARRHGAKSLEVRAALSLGTLWRDEGRHIEARRLVAGVYAGFPEGLDTHDLQKAKSLLEELV